MSACNTDDHKVQSRGFVTIIIQCEMVFLNFEFLVACRCVARIWVFPLESSNLGAIKFDKIGKH